MDGMSRFANPILSVFLLSYLWWGCQSSLYDGPKSPQESLSSFDIIDGFNIELFAQEPMIVDPVDLQFDEWGRIYAVEMPDYPFKPAPGAGKGRIKQLFDSNDNGVIDSTIVFADGISEATSILPWKGGLLVAAAPNISFLRDADGDGQADSSEVIFTGFFENNSEAQITNLTYGIDNWIYASNHGQSGTIKFLRDTSQSPLNIQGGDFRFRLDQDLFELEAGPAQFGQSFNDRWHRFITQNSLHIRHIVIPWRYAHRHTYMPSTQVAHNISDHEAEMFQQTPSPFWRAERTRRRQEKYDAQGLGRKEYAEDYFTGCSGGTFYGGHQFAQEFYGNIFTGDVAGNLIHRDIIQPSVNGITYVATRAAEERDREFLFSTDSWFRPAHFRVGPDGFLYVVDYYRQHIETPLSIPVDLKERMDFLKGDDMGRIYRIAPTLTAASRSDRILGDLPTRDLVQLLQHPNRWQRLSAQRIILERQDRASIGLLESLLDDPSLTRPRLHALYALEALDALKEKHIVTALAASYPALREHGLILAERFENGPQLIGAKLSDPDPRVAFQAILSLGQFPSNEHSKTLAELVTAQGQNEWIRLAVLSAPAATSIEFTQHLLELHLFGNDNAEVNHPVLSDLAKLIGIKNDVEHNELFLSLLVHHVDPAKEGLRDVLNSFAQGVKRSKKEAIFDLSLSNREAHPNHEMIWSILQEVLNATSDS